MTTLQLAEKTVPEKKVIASYLMLIVATIFWGSAFVGSKIALADVPPSVAAVIRFGLGSFFMMIYLFARRRKELRIQRKMLLPIVSHGFIGVAIYNLLFFWALRLSFASDGSMIIPTMSPAITILIATFLLKERLVRKQIIGLTVALLGSMLFFYVVIFSSTLNTNRLFGDLMFLGAAVCWAIYSTLGKKIFQHINPLPATAYGMLFGTLMVAIYAIPELIKLDWYHLPIQFWLIQLYLAIFPTFFSYIFFNTGIKEIGSARATTFMYIVPISGLLLAGLILADIPEFLQFVGAAFMLLGVWIINRR